MKTEKPACFLSRILKVLLLTAGVFSTHRCHSQADEAVQKLSPLLFKDIHSGKLRDKTNFRITIKAGMVPAEINDAIFSSRIIYESGSMAVYSLMATPGQLDSILLKLPGIIFIERNDRMPKEELQISNLDLSVNKINIAHRNFPAQNGEGIVGSVKENKPDTTDTDFKGRFFSTNLSSSTVSSHASVMSTMMAGGGNSWHLGKGVAWGSTISSSGFATLLPDAINAYQQYNISVQNHSYGVGVENFYGADAAAYDGTAINIPSLLHVFSSGNSGASSPATGMYAGLPGFANETGSFKMGKNILTVGATDSFSVVAALSSKGPAHDGRVKPELVAFGEDGSSGAAALVSGAALLIQQGYKQANGSLPSNALVRAIIINSADDVGNAQVDYANGYGALNVSDALKTLSAQRYFNGSVGNGLSQSFIVPVPVGLKELKVTLVWNDPPAQPNAVKALINDLDLELVRVSTGQTWQPWVLNHFPHPDSLVQLAKRKKDSLNNIEQVTLENPAPGTYEFKITGVNVSAGSQSFYLAYQLDSLDGFEWQFPAVNDFIFPSTSNVVRWNSSFTTGAGMLEYSSDNGNSWQWIQSNIDLSSGYYRWNVPPFTGKSLLRMSIGAAQIVSDTFTIARRTITGVGFNCPDSFLIYWNKLPSVTNYRVYQLGNKYLEPMTLTADSFMLFSKNTNPSLHYAVAPVISNKEGVKSYTFNYTTQGVDCYFRSFLALLSGNNAQLTLSLGTLYNVNRIVVEKYDGSGFIAWQQVNNPTLLLYNLTDPALKKGLNIYRVRLELAGGRVIYSSVETVYYFKGAEFIVYPNPADQYLPLTILADNQFEPATLQVLNIQGQKIYEMKLNDVVNQLPAGRLSKGIYLLRIIRKDQKNVVLKLFIQ